MSKSIIGIASSRQQVEEVITDLRTSGIAPADLSVLMPESGGVPETGTVKSTKAPEGATAGAVGGGIAGGSLGLLAGIGTLAIPGIGPFIAAGPIMAALSGAAVGATAGGVIGALVGMGIPELEAKVYENRIKEGGYLVAAHISDSHNKKEIREIFERNKLEDVSSVTDQ